MEVNLSYEKRLKILDVLKEQSVSIEEMAARADLVKQLTQLDGHDTQLCKKTLKICLPLMNMRAKQPEEGWLASICSHLAYNIFPTSDHPVSELNSAERLFLAILEALNQYHEGEFDPLKDVIELKSEDIEDSDVKTEYAKFEKTTREAHVLSLMRIVREVEKYDPASHTIGVHNVALHTAILAKKAGFNVDLAMVSAASLCHDIGKFGCRGADATRIPYLHYYYTWKWFSSNGMENIGHIAANHSTWDLEFENLPIESLLLIYADFRVRGTRDKDGQERMRIYSLADAYTMIFSKLADMTPEKKQKYQTVFYKLHDFEQLLISEGISADIEVNTLQAVSKKNAALMNATEALQSLCGKTLSGSMNLMGVVSSDTSFAQLLEQAKSDKNLYRIRTYLLLFGEYSTYMSKANKKRLLVLLYELLAHTDGDVRHMSAVIMGSLLANSGIKYRKERPTNAEEVNQAPTMTAMLDESVELWKNYMNLCLHPDRKNSPDHALRIYNSLKTVCRTMFEQCDKKDVPAMMEPLIQTFIQSTPDEWFALADTMCMMPKATLNADTIRQLLPTLEKMIHAEESRVRVIALDCLSRFVENEEVQEPIRAMVSNLDFSIDEYKHVLDFKKCQVLNQPRPVLSAEEISNLYLNNLKNSIHWMIKLTQIAILYETAKDNEKERFHTALHFSNLLCVSEHLPVRETAGDHLIMISPYLTVDQLNEICCDLLREMETGQEQIVRFIPPYIGRIICVLPEKEQLEAVNYLEEMVRGNTVRTANVALRTIGEIIANAKDMKTPMVNHLLGILMTGVSHFDDDVYQTALRTVCCEIFGNENISLENRGEIFVRIHKKLLTLLCEPHTGSLSAFTSAAMLNHLYRFIVQYKVYRGEFVFEKEKKVAFFPGTFDPFSVGHKQIVEEIRKLGFEVYLAVDEFSWSKKTLAKLLRRQIVNISAADQWDTYLFPDDIPINIAMPKDLKILADNFKGREVYLVAGSDVIKNASAYKSKLPHSAAYCNHIVFNREGSDESAEELRQIIRGRLQLLALPSFYETVSSTRIREYIDSGLDISMLVDPVVQSFIYERGLYIREPESKDVLEQEKVQFHLYNGREQIPEDMKHIDMPDGESMAVALRSRDEGLIGWATGHTVAVKDLYEILKSVEVASDVRRHVSGRLLVIDDVSTLSGEPDAEYYRMLLNELLARSLDSDHTYSICRCAVDNDALRDALIQLGYVSVQNCDDLYYVDMRTPVVLLQDVMLMIKQPLHDDPNVRDVISQARPKLRKGLTTMFPGMLLLCFDSEMMNQALMERIQKLNGVDRLPEGVRLGKSMCVPYGKVLSDVVVPHTVTKALHVEKCFAADVKSFEIKEYPDYSPIRNQVRMLKSFERPVLLVDDLLHNGYRMKQLDKVFQEEQFYPEKIVVAIMSGRGNDIMKEQKRAVECEYFIPNLHYWVNESLMYPFIGGDSIEGIHIKERMLPSINLSLPYYYPNFFRDVDERKVQQISRIVLENTIQIMRELERAHQKKFATTLTIARLGEALRQPRLPGLSSCMQYDFSKTATRYLEEDLLHLQRICRRERDNK